MFSISTAILLAVLHQRCQSSLPNSTLTVAKSGNKFAVDLYRTLATKNDSTTTNLFFSPLSISTVLAMIYLGARGNTATELAKTLHWDGIPDKQLHNAMKEFLGIINSTNGKENELITANRLFVQQGLKIAQFKSETAKFYGAEVAQVDYKANPGAARNQINNWVKQQTKDKINNIIPEGGFDANTRLVLVNAVYFRGFWEQTFDKKRTSNALFMNSLGNETSIPMMELQKGAFKMYINRELKFKTIELPYKEKRMSMFIILPQERNGLPNLEKVLTFELLEETIAKTKQAFLKKGMSVIIPKFNITQSFELRQVLKDLGAASMFSGAADFSGITQSEKLQVSKVIYKAVVEVNEEGTVASAATTAHLGKLGIVTFVADHPFIFIIANMYKNIDSILFIGRFSNPVKG